jgi:transposase
MAFTQRDLAYFAVTFGCARTNHVPQVRKSAHRMLRIIVVSKALHRRRRHKIENYFCRIKDWRRIATRYDKLARNFLAAAVLVGALYWIKL